MQWVIDKLNQIKEILALIFMIVVGGYAIKLLKDNKIIAILLFAVAAGILGWFVLDARSAIQTMINVVK